VRVYNFACHSWSVPLRHFHHTLASELATTLSGKRFPFLVGCHCAATVGNREARELVTETFRPAQHGQPVGLDLCARSATFACHSWSGPFGHFHQTFLLHPGITWSGVKLPFRDGCHSATSSGKSAASDFVIETFCPAQQGHPFPRVRLLIAASHSWDGST